MSTFVWSILGTGTLQSFFSDVLIPAYSRKYNSLLAAIDTHLKPLGVTVGGAAGWWVIFAVGVTEMVRCGACRKMWC